MCFIGVQEPGDIFCPGNVWRQGTANYAQKNSVVDLRTWKIFLKNLWSVPNVDKETSSDHKNVIKWNETSYGHWNVFECSGEETTCKQVKSVQVNISIKVRIIPIEMSSCLPHAAATFAVMITIRQVMTNASSSGLSPTNQYAIVANIKGSIIKPGI